MENVHTGDKHKEKTYTHARESQGMTESNKGVGKACTYHGCGFTVAFRWHLHRLVLHCWQQQSVGVITVQSARAPAECHCQGPAIRYGTPNGYLGRMATINYHYSSHPSPLIPLILYCLTLLCSSYVFLPGFYLRSFFHLLPRCLIHSPALLR